MIRFISFCNKPLDAAKKVVNAPIIVIIKRVAGLYSNRGLDLINKYIPAVTSVAAWSKEETGVGCEY